MRGIACVVAAVVAIAGGSAGAEPRHDGIVVIGGRQDLRRHDLHRNDLHRNDLHRHDLHRHDLHRLGDARRDRHPGPRVIGLRRGRDTVDYGPGVGGFGGAPYAAPFDGAPDGVSGPGTGDLSEVGGGAPPDTYEQVRPRYYQEPSYEHSAPPVIYRMPSGRAVTPLPPVAYCGGYDDDCAGRRRARVYGGY